jgi:peroxiredoxin (alkyl hydroperoxide reductase subunit C)
MPTLVSRPAPDFSATAVLGDGSLREDFRLSGLRGRNVLLFFYPLDFTFVCPTEILAFDEKLPEFEARETEVVGVSVDSVYAHLAWKKTPVEKGGIGPIRYPLVSDLRKSIADSYGVLHEDGTALRGLFLIDREGVVRHALVNDMALGRSVDEALRTVDALRHHEARGNLCPANWTEGEEGMEPTAEGAAGYLARYRSTSETPPPPSKDRSAGPHPRSAPSP